MRDVLGPLRREQGSAARIRGGREFHPGRPLVAAAFAAVAAAVLVTLLVAGHTGAGSAGPRRAHGSPTPSPASIVMGGARSRSAGVAEAAKVGERFLRAYVRYVYGLADGAELPQATADLRRMLRRSRVRVPPARSGRSPEIAAVQAIPQAPGVVQVTATVHDGDVAPYFVTALVELRDGRWRVTRLADD